MCRVLEKSKSNTSNNSAMTTTSTDNLPVSPSKVPNILRGTSSPSKNTIDRQIVSHEATIEFRKNIFSRPIPASNNAIVSNTTTTTSSKDTVSSIINGKLQKSTEINNTSKDSQKISPSETPKVDLLQPINSNNKILPQETPKVDLLQPLKSDDNATDDIDLSDLNLKCRTNEFGALEINTNQVSDDSDLDLICRETVQTTPPKSNESTTTSVPTTATATVTPKKRFENKR